MMQYGYINNSMNPTYKMIWELWKIANIKKLVRRFKNKWLTALQLIFFFGACRLKMSLCTGPVEKNP